MDQPGSSVLAADTLWHMILPSYGSSDIFSNNSPSDFTTLLRTPLVADGDTEYEVALTDLHFVSTTPAVSDILVSYQKPKISSTIPDPIEIGLAKKNHTSVASLVKELQKEIEDKAPTARRGGHFVKFSYSETTFKTTVTLVEGHSITLSKDLATILGFEKVKITETTTSERESDLHRGIHNAYVFCEQTEDIVFGRGRAKILGFTGIPPGSVAIPQVVNKSFENPVFVKIMNKRTDRIRLYLRTENGEANQFAVGPTVVRLTVRRKNSK